MSLTEIKMAEAVDEISAEAEKVLDRLEVMGFSNERVLDILGVAALTMLSTCPLDQRQVVYDAWIGRLKSLTGCH